MSKKKASLKRQTAVSISRKPYQKPIILYEGFVSTRAGSPIEHPNEGEFDIINFLLGKNK